MPLIGGYQTDMIAEAVLSAAFDPVSNLGLTRHELLIACWYQAVHGIDPKFRKHWGSWARYVGIDLCRGELGIDDLPMPPRLLRSSDPGE